MSTFKEAKVDLIQLEDGSIKGAGCLSSGIDVRDYKINVVENLPEEYKVKVGKIKNQLNRGTCTSHAAASIVEYFYNEQHGTYRNFSTDFINGNRPEESEREQEGLSIRRAVKTLYNYGDLFEDDMPGNNDQATCVDKVMPYLDVLEARSKPHSITAYWRCDSNDAVKTSIYHYGPCIVSMKWFDDIRVGSKGVISTKYAEDKNHKNDYTNHAIVVFGWNAIGWICKNSWGYTFGNRGTFVIPYALLTLLINEVWGMTDENIENDNFSYNKMPKWLASITNFFIRLFTGLGVKLFK